MFDLNEIRKRAQMANEQALDAIKEAREKSGELAAHAEISHAEDTCPSAAETEAQINANTQRQVEILGQVFGGDSMSRMTVNEELLQNMVKEQVAAAASSNAEQLMAQFFGEDAGVLAAALEMLGTEDEDAEEEDIFDEQLEQRLYTVLEETITRIDSLPEPEPISYQKQDQRWKQFGILLSGIVSTLNDHSLRGMDVEEHIPVLEQQVVSIVWRSWGINGRSDLLDKIRYLAQEGYVLRYRIYSEAESPESLLDEDMDEEERESVCRAWRFVQRYKRRYTPGFLTGWDIGRAAMLARWGSYLGWITEQEALGILWDLSRKAVEEIHSWREFAASYLFGGLLWKLLCGDSSAESYLGYLADAASKLLIGRTDSIGGEWRQCPWPAERKIGFT